MINIRTKFINFSTLLNCSSREGKGHKDDLKIFGYGDDFFLDVRGTPFPPPSPPIIVKTFPAGVYFSPNSSFNVLVLIALVTKLKVVFGTKSNLHHFYVPSFYTNHAYIRSCTRFRFALFLLGFMY